MERVSKSAQGNFLHLLFFTERPDDGLTYAKNAVAAAVDAGVTLLVWNASGEILLARGANPAFDLRLDILDVIAGSGVPYRVSQPTTDREFLGSWLRKEIVQDDTFAQPM